MLKRRLLLVDLFSRKLHARSPASALAIGLWKKTFLAEENSSPRKQIVEVVTGSFHGDRHVSKFLTL